MKELIGIKCEFTSSKGDVIKIDKGAFDRNYDDEETAMIFVTDRRSKQDGYFELNVMKDEQGRLTEDAYVCEYENTDATDPYNMIKDIKVELEYGEVVYVVSYVGLSDSEYDANGYCENAVYDTIDAAKAKLQSWKENEIQNLQDEGREYELLKDEDDEVRIGWCGYSEQVRLEIHKVVFNK